MSKRKNINSNNLKLKSFMKMQIINASVFFVIFLVFILISVCGDIGIDLMLYIALAFTGLASFISGCIAGFKERRKGIICGIVNVLPFNVVLLIISLVFNGFQADISLLISLITGLLAAAVGGIVAVNIRVK